MWSTISPDGHRKYLTRRETDQFILLARNESMSVYTFCWFLTETGCRISEALAISPRNFDFSAGLVIVESLKKRRTGVFRAVPLPARLLRALDGWIRRQAITPEARLWPWSRMTGYRRVTEVMRKAGLTGPWASPKGLRHAFGVRAVQSGAPLHLVQRWLGHADMKTTAIYAAATGPEEREIAARTWLCPDRRTDRPPPPPGPPSSRLESRPAAQRSPRRPDPVSVPEPGWFGGKAAVGGILPRWMQSLLAR